MTVLRVVAGILRREDAVLLTERPAGKELAGAWEFPGGKCEPGEGDVEALRRELDEELGIRITGAAAFVSVPHEAAGRTLHLLGYIVHDWRGEPRSCEGQALGWYDPRRVDRAMLAPADRLILAALLHAHAGP